MESILRTDALRGRPQRPPDHETESRALVALAQGLADSPETILQTLAETVLKVLRCGSAGLSLLADDGNSFHWPTIAGAWQLHLGGGTPRDFGPCGNVLDCNAPLLFTHWERRYPYLLVITPPAEEGLVAPFYVSQRAVGTIWALAHDKRREFDAEDLRLLETLGRFASAAYQAVASLDVEAQRRAALSLMEDAVEARQLAEDLNRQLGADAARALGAAAAALRPKEAPETASPDPVPPNGTFAASSDEPASVDLDAPRRAALNLMEDAVEARQIADNLNRRLRAEMAERERSAVLLLRQKEALEMVAQQAPLSELLDFLARTAESHSQEGMMAAIHLLNADGTHFASAAAPSLPPAYVQATEGLAIGSLSRPCCSVVASREPAIVPDVARDPRWPRFAEFAAPCGIQAGWSTPILSAGGTVLGTFALYYPEPRAPSPRDQQLVGVLTRTVALAIERRQAEERLRHSERVQRLLAEIGVLATAIGGAGGMEVEDLIQAMAERVAAELSVSRCGLAEVNLETGELTIAQDAHGDLPSLEGSYTVADTSARFVHDGMAGRTTVVTDLAADPRTASRYEGTYAPIGVRAHINVPLFREGRCVANFWVSSGEPRRWSEDEVALMESVGGRVWLVVGQARTAAALRASEARLSLSQQVAKVGTFEWNVQTGLNHWSHELAAMYGLKPGDFEKTEPAFEDLVHADDRPELGRCVEQSFETGAPTDAEWRVVWPDRSVHWLAGRWQVFKDGAGKPLRVVGVNIDITARKQAEGAIQEQAAALADLHRRKDEFLAMLSHELRNPLAPITNALELLRGQRGSENATEQHARVVIERQVGQLKHLVDDLLEVSRVTTGRVRLRLERIAVGGIAERAVETVRPLIDQRRHELSVSVPPELIWVHGDAARIEQVLVNLLTNAAKYTDEGGRIRLAVEQEGDSAVVRVRDTGVGIAPELLPRIFELFTQAERSLDRAGGGLGIGLSLVQRLVELHGGTVEATSVLGQGSEFVVRLPVVSPPAIPSPSPTETVSSTGRSCRVLVVDDNVDAAESLAALLKVSGHDVRAVHDGEAALEAALKLGPEVVLLDIGLPGLDGYEVAKRMRQHPALQGVVIVALTGYGQDADRQRSQDVGIDRHLVKPVEPATIQSIVANVPKTAR